MKAAVLSLGRSHVYVMDMNLEITTYAVVLRYEKSAEVIVLSVVTDI